MNLCKAVLNSQIKVSYLSQNLSNLTGYITDYAQIHNIKLSDLLNLLHKLGFKRAVFEQRLENLSLGQKNKISLATSLCQEANLYIWDEPLNYLDIITRNQIEDLILKSAPTMIIIEHDKEFIDSIATKEIILEKY